MASQSIVDRVNNAGYPQLALYSSDELFKMIYPKDTRTFKEVTNNKERKEVQIAMRNKLDLVLKKHTKDVIAWDKTHPQLASEYDAHFKHTAKTAFS